MLFEAIDLIAMFFTAGLVVAGAFLLHIIAHPFLERDLIKRTDWRFRTISLVLATAMAYIICGITGYPGELILALGLAIAGTELLFLNTVSRKKKKIKVERIFKPAAGDEKNLAQVERFGEKGPGL